MMRTFRDFVLHEMKKRNMSARQFALFVGVDPTTVTRAIDAAEPTRPGLDFLIKLAKATKISGGVIFELAYPDVATEADLSPESRILAQQIEQLPENRKEAIDLLIIGSGN